MMAFISRVIFFLSLSGSVLAQEITAEQILRNNMGTTHGVFKLQHTYGCDLDVDITESGGRLSVGVDVVSSKFMFYPGNSWTVDQAAHTLTYFPDNSTSRGIRFNFDNRTGKITSFRDTE